MPPPSAVEIAGVHKRFGAVHAVRGLDLVLEPGRVYGLLGPNGSGKTTTMRMVLSILLPDEGNIRVLGKPRASESKSRIGYLPEDRGLYKSMRVRQFLVYMARLRGLSAVDAKERVVSWLDRVGLSDKLKARCGTLSRGQQQRVQTIAAVIHEPDLLILDEPFSGLDPVSRRQLEQIFLEQRARGCTLVVSTHMMHHAEEICDHVVMMDRGEKVLDLPLEQARRMLGASVLRCEVTGLVEVAAVEALEGVGGAALEGPSLRVQVAEDADPSKVLARVAASVPLVKAEIGRASLEEVFVHTVETRRGGQAA